MTHAAPPKHGRHRPNRSPAAGLPAPAMPLIGREADVQQAAALLDDSDVRLLTLTGPAGVGKTRLAVEIVRTHGAAFRDGAVFVPLANIDRFELAIPALCRTLGMPEGDRRYSFRALQQWLRHKHVLMLLDNFEQLSEAVSDLSELLSSCDVAKIVVTSRSALHISHEHEFPVAPLPVPDLANLPRIDALMACPSVALFVRRARAVRRDFTLTPDNARPVAEICARLEGLPLSIELAAARVKLLEPHAILNRLQRRLQLLTHGSRDLPPRHQTLRGAIEWSYRLLHPEEQALFARLAVFAGGFGLDAAAAVCEDACPSPHAVLDHVASLLDKSLLQRTERVGGEPRLVMLETMREYAAEQLEASGGAAQVRRAHAAYYLSLAEQAEPVIIGGDQAPWLERFDLEHDNLRAALQHALELEDGGVTALRLGAALWPFWLLGGHLREGTTWLERALGQSGAVPSPLRAKALNAAGMLALNQGDYGRAASLCGESLAICRKLEDNHGIGAALNGLGQVVLFWQNDYIFARALYEERLAIFRALGDRRGIAHSLERLGLVAWLEGDYAVAGRLFTESRSLYEAAGIRQGLANALVGLGHVALSQGRHQPGRQLYQQALEIFAELRNRPGTARAMFGLGWAAAELGDYAAARRQYEDSVRIFHALDDKWYTPLCLAGLAGVAAAEHNLDLAARLFGTADAVRESAGVPMPPSLLESYERRRERVRTKLGEAAWAAAVDAGRRLTPEQVLVPVGPRAPEPGAPVADAARATLASRGLTARETDVLRLVARGLTSAQIAKELAISPLTVNVHLRRIYGKLDVNTRSGATRFAVEHHLC